jgi:hypothetical protein
MGAVNEGVALLVEGLMGVLEGPGMWVATHRVEQDDAFLSHRTGLGQCTRFPNHIYGLDNLCAVSM